MLIQDAIHYAELEAGARYLAGETGSAAERAEHLSMADIYARRRAAAARWGRN